MLNGTRRLSNLLLLLLNVRIEVGRLRSRRRARGEVVLLSRRGRRSLADELPVLLLISSGHGFLVVVLAWLLRLLRRSLCVGRRGIVGLELRCRNRVGERRRTLTGVQLWELLWWWSGRLRRLSVLRLSVYGEKSDQLVKRERSARDDDGHCG